MKLLSRITFLTVFCALLGFSSVSQTQGVDKEKLKMMMEAFNVEQAEPTEVKPNEFIGSFRLTVKNYNKASELQKTSVIDIHADKFPVCFEITTNEKAQKKMRMILDPSKRTMTTLIDEKGKKTGMIAPMPRFGADAADLRVKVAENKSEIQIEATDEYRKIEGYNCRKYIIKDKDAVTESWITTEEAVSIENILSMFTVLQIGADGGGLSGKQGDIRGMLLESTTTMSDGQKMLMTLTNIIKGEVDASRFSTAGYNVTDFTKSMGK